MTLKDSENLEELINSVTEYCSKNNIDFKHILFIKNTESLNRFGTFIFDNEEYMVSGWKYKDKIVTFENKKSNLIKIKYSLLNGFMNNKTVKKTIFVKLKDDLRYTLKKFLKDLSEKL